MEWIFPVWPAPATIQAGTTTRYGGGVSMRPYDSFNLAAHVNDNEQAVSQNRHQFLRAIGLTDPPVWLTQKHSTRVLNLDHFKDGDGVSYDACYTSKTNTMCAVLTADCLPILVCSSQTGEIAAIHAGWRGLCNGIIENTCSLFHARPDSIMVWLGPAISAVHFEVGRDVKDVFESASKDSVSAFTLIDKSRQKYKADLHQLARQRFKCQGITAFYGGEYCTFSQSDRFFSYRRQPITGRMVSFIWRQD